MKQTFKTLKQTNTIKIMNTTYSVAELQKMLADAQWREALGVGINTNKPTNICHLPDDILGMVENRVLDIALKNKLNKQILRAHPDRLWSEEYWWELLWFTWSTDRDITIFPHSDYPEYYDEEMFALLEGEQRNYEAPATARRPSRLYQIKLNCAGYPTGEFWWLKSHLLPLMNEYPPFISSDEED